MPKKMTPKSQLKIKLDSCNTHFLTIFNPKKSIMQTNNHIYEVIL